MQKGVCIDVIYKIYSINNILYIVYLFTAIFVELLCQAVKDAIGNNCNKHYFTEYVGEKVIKYLDRIIQISLIQEERNYIFEESFQLFQVRVANVRILFFKLQCVSI